MTQVAISSFIALLAALFLWVAYRHWTRSDPRLPSQGAVAGAILILMASTMVALAGPDLGISCDTVRSYRAEIAAMSPETRAKLARSFNVTRKQRRQAMACLRKVN